VAAVAQHHDELLGWRTHRRLHGLRRLSTMPQLHQPTQRARGADRFAMADDLHLQLDWRGTEIRNKKKGWNQSEYLPSTAELLAPSVHELKGLVRRRTERY
jgi:hypothetical protein